VPAASHLSVEMLLQLASIIIIIIIIIITVIFAPARICELVKACCSDKVVRQGA